MVARELFQPGVRNGSTKLWVASLSTIIVRTVSSEWKLAADRAGVVATNAPKAPSGMPRFGGGDSGGVDPCWSAGVVGTAGLPADSVAADAEVEVDAVASTKEAPTALNENPNVFGSG